MMLMALVNTCWLMLKPAMMVNSSIISWCLAQMWTNRYTTATHQATPVNVIKHCAFIKITRNFNRWAIRIRNHPGWYDECVGCSVGRWGWEGLAAPLLYHSFCCSRSLGVELLSEMPAWDHQISSDLFVISSTIDSTKSSRISRTKDYYRTASDHMHPYANLVLRYRLGIPTYKVLCNRLSNIFIRS